MKKNMRLALLFVAAILTNANSALADGRLAPDFKGPLVSGGEFRLSDHIGKEMVVLNFFTTSCGPCQYELPAMDRFATDHKQDGVVVVGVDVIENTALVKSFLERIKVTFPAVVDSGELSKALDVTGYPTTVVIGVDGTIQFWQLGVIDVPGVLWPLLEKNRALRTSGGAISSEVFRQRQEQASHSLITLTPPEAKPGAGYVADPSRHNEIFDIKVLQETPQILIVGVDYYYTGDHGDKRIYIDCDPHVSGGDAPFGMRPAATETGRHTANAYMASYSATPNGVVSTTVTCSLSSRIDGKTLATKTIAHTKTWSR